MEYNTRNEEETRRIGANIGSSLNGGDIILLEGDMGAGKTTFTKGLAEGLGVTDEILSPTFTLLNLYRIKNQESRIKNLVHVDTYRLTDAQQLINIGIEDYLGDAETICVIEWPEKISPLLKNKKTILIRLAHTDNGGRTISVQTYV